MKTRAIVIAFTILLIVAIPFVTKGNDERGAGSVRIVPDLLYVDKAAGDPSKQSLDLYIPTRTSGPLPLIVFIHGGAWVEGDKKDNPGLAIAPLGFAVASINYRLSTDAIFPAQIYDCKAAIRYLRKNATKYGINPNKIGVWGTSAGGYLAALLATTSNTNKLDGNLGANEESSAVQAALDWCGPTDLLTISEQAGSKTKIDFETENGPVGRLLGGLQTEKKELAVEASPVTYVDKQDPPILIVHGDIDDLVPFAQSEEFQDKLLSVGASSKLICVRGGGHWLGTEREYRRAVDFFRATLMQSEHNFTVDEN